MATKAQIKANRRNALKSTGPRTPGGKAAVSRNALKHGFAVRDADLGPEAEAEIAQLAREYCRDLRPYGPRETLQVRQLAIAAWRLSRLPQLEDALWAKCTLANGFRPLNTLGRYRSRVDRSFYRAFKELERLQALRGKRKEQSQSPVRETTHL